MTPATTGPRPSSMPLTSSMGGLVSGFMKFMPPMDMLPLPRNGFTTSADNFCSGWKNISKGRKMTTETRLKKSCTVAAAKARRNSLPSRTWPRETRVLVMVVPIFAPITMGMAMPTGRPPATSATIMDVTVEEL